MIGYLCVFRHSETEPWQPVGLLRNEVREGSVGQKDRLAEYLRKYVKMTANERRHMEKWARLWVDIHAKDHEEVFTAPSGKQYGLLRMRVTPYDETENFGDPERMPHFSDPEER